VFGCAKPAPPPAPPPPPAVVVAPSPPVHVQVLAINDFHGNLEPPHGHDGTVMGPNHATVEAGGAAYLAAHMKQLAAKNPNTVMVSAGDLTGASPLVSSLFGDEPTVLVMNHIGLDFAGIGNHDLDRGLVELMRLATGGPASRSPLLPDAPPAAPFPGAHYKYLAANVTGPDGETIFPPYGIKQFGSVKLAFIGMTLVGTPSVTTHGAIRGLTFSPEASTANKLVPELRHQGVTTAVVLLHQGGFQGEGGTYDSCVGLKGDVLPVVEALDPWFRVIVTAHTHQAYDCKIGQRVVTSASSYGRLITDIDLTIDPERNELVDVQATNVPVSHDLAPDPDVVAIVDGYEAKAAPVTQRVVGYQAGPLTRDPAAAHSPSCETPLGDLIADAQLDDTRSAHAVVAFMNPGGIRTDLTPPPESPSGAAPIRYASVFEVQPFGNALVTLTLTGAEIQAVLARQFTPERPRVLSVSRGFTYRYTYDRAAHAVTIDPASVRLNGRPLGPQQQYRVTVNSFLADGGDGFAIFHDAKERTVGDVDIDALVHYLGKASSKTNPVKAPAKLDRVVGDACR
jgi:5'-nucleotidase